MFCYYNVVAICTFNCNFTEKFISISIFWKTNQLIFFSPFFPQNTKNKTAVKLTAVSCAPVVEVKIKRPDTKYQLGFSVQNGVVSKESQITKRNRKYYLAKIGYMLLWFHQRWLNNLDFTCSNSLSDSCESVFENSSEIDYRLDII